MTPVSGLPIKKYAGIFIAFELTLYTYIYFLYASLFLKKVIMFFSLGCKEPLKFVSVKITMSESSRLTISEIDSRLDENPLQFE